MTKTDASEAATAPKSLLRQLGGEIVFILSPRLFAWVAGLSGVALLIALAMPNTLARVNGGEPPLPLLEASHFLSSLAGTALLILSLGLRQRMREAWIASLIMFAVGAGLVLVGGRHLGIAAVMALGAAGLLVSRSAFYRQGSLARMKLGWEAALLILAALIAIAWLGFFFYRHVGYSHDLWWTFAVNADASRFLRGLVLVVVSLVLFVFWRVMQPSGTPPEPARTRDLTAQIASVVNGPESRRADAALAFLPDKRFLFSETGDAFVMFGVRGRKWICMGEPVGPCEVVGEMSANVKHAADLAGADLIFYAVGVEFLPVALDLGLSVQKIGETAIIDLADYTLEGSRRARQRQAVNKLEREGARFEVIAAGGFDAMAGELKVVSDSWLAGHAGVEKRFTLGAFDADYLRQFPIAIVWHAQKPVAFINVWRSGDGRGFEIDLMRHHSDAPAGVMDYLIVKLALWAKEQGGETLSLGMAPLSGLATGREADVLSRLGALIYSHGEDVYGFDGLRRYKEKFHPRWAPVYLAAPDRLELATSLADVALLTSGGLTGMLKRPKASGDSKTKT